MRKRFWLFPCVVVLLFLTSCAGIEQHQEEAVPPESIVGGISGTGNQDPCHAEDSEDKQDCRKPQ